MKKQRKKSPCRKRTVFSLLLSAGLSAPLILGSPAFAEEAATDTAASEYHHQPDFRMAPRA